MVESTTFGSINSIQIINDGDNYRVSNSAEFDNTGTEGGGLSVSVDSIKGKTINSIDTTINSYDNVVFFKNEIGEISASISTAPSLNNGDRVVISGLSTTLLPDLNGSFIIGIETCLL